MTGVDLRMIDFYLDAKQHVLRSGYEAEIRWQESIRLESIILADVRREMAWVVLSSGMREAVIRTLFTRISEIFLDWTDDQTVLRTPSMFIRSALRLFNHPQKIGAIVDNISRLAAMGMSEFRTRLAANGPPFLTCFTFIGPVTCWHLAKNLGGDVAKPDRHLVRIAQAAGAATVADICSKIAAFTGDRVAVIDLVLWRFATIVPDYEARVSHRVAPNRASDAHSRTRSNGRQSQRTDHRQQLVEQQRDQWTNLADRPSARTSRHRARIMETARRSPATATREQEQH